ncbi:MAG TPA: peptidoglycan-binding protein [Ruminococcaceae bacterium]|nr:peptidoglycan-binding protein [Oscillospiraceae bacterium]
MKKAIKLISSTALASILTFNLYVSASAAGIYTVKSGDSLWKISTANGLSVTQLKQYNRLESDIINIGQKLSLSPTVKYTVKSGDTLWLISQKYSTTVANITDYNKLSSSVIYPNQILYIPTGAVSQSALPQPVTSWPSITYIVKAGDYLSTVAAKFGVSQADIMKYNYMREGEWLDEGEKIAINGYAPRNYAVMPGESSSPSKVGKLVDWFLDGQYLIKRNDIFLITDIKSGLQFKVKMLGGINHSDVEPLTAADTLIMKKLFPTWVWAPRPVVIFHNGINFAASLSGMPHGVDSIASNNVNGHFDLYLYNSIGHDANVSSTYVQQHKNNVLIAAGMK